MTFEKWAGSWCQGMLLDSDDSARVAHAAAKAAWDAGQHSRWQSVDTLPEEDTPVLGLDVFRDIYVCSHHNSFFIDSDMFDISITHWMPLPEPPEDE